MRTFPVTYWALALVSLEVGVSSASEPTRLEFDRRQQFTHSGGPEDRRDAYEVPMGSLEKQLLQLKREGFRGYFLHEVALSAEPGVKEEKQSGGRGMRLVPQLRMGPGAASAATTQTVFLGERAATPTTPAEPASQQSDAEGAAGPSGDDGRCAEEEADVAPRDFARDLARQLVNYASARAADDALCLLERMTSSAKKWIHVRHILRELDKELEVYQDANNEVDSSRPSTKYGEIRSLRKHEGRNKRKKHKKKGVKKKPRHKEKVKIKVDEARENSEALPSTRRSGKIFLGGTQKNEVSPRRENTTFPKNRRTYSGSAATELPKNLSPLDELMQTLAAQSRPRDTTEALLNDVGATDTSPMNAQRDHENEVAGTRDVLQKVSFVKPGRRHNKNSHTRHNHGLIEALNSRAQKVRTEADEEKFLRMFHDDLNDWRSHESGNDWPMFKSKHRTNVYHNDSEGVSTAEETGDRATSHAPARPGSTEAASRRPGGGGPWPSTTPTSPAAPRHGGGGPALRRLFAYHRVTASPRLRAPHRSAFVAVSMVSPAAPVRRRASLEAAAAATTPVPGDRLEEELLSLVTGRDQKYARNSPRSREQGPGTKKQKPAASDQFPEHWSVVPSVRSVFLSTGGRNL